MVLNKIREALALQLEICEDEIQWDTDIVEDLGADSLDVAELLASLEEEFGLVITDESVYQLKTVGEVVEFIEKLM